MALITKKPFTEWILVFAKLYFLPIGRIGRIEFCITFATVVLIAYLGVFLPGSQIEMNITGISFDFTKMAKPASAQYTLPPGKDYFSQLIGINTIICLWIFLVSTVKRLRDLNSKGWYAIFILVPFVNLFILLGLMLSEGTPGMNRHGPQKKPLSL